MQTRAILVSFFVAAALTAQVARDHDVGLKNWPAPLYWQPSYTESEALRAEIRTASPEAATPAGSLVFVAMTPCRVVDTRASSMFAAPFGAPSLVANATRSFPIQSSALCTIPSTAQAYSFNVTLVPPGPVGYLTIWPTAAPPNAPPNAVTLDDYPTGDIRNNAAIVPDGITNGSVSAITNAATDLVIDINGYYAPSTGITLAQGSATAPSLSFSGDAGTGIFSSGTGALNFSTEGINALTVRSDGDLDMPGSLRKGGTLFVHNLGTDNTAVGIGALNPSSTGTFNTATGADALAFNIDGFGNTATGTGALNLNTSGGENTALGADALENNTTGSINIAIGALAGTNITTGNSNIDIGNTGLSGDSSAIRIGDSAYQSSFFAAGISGVMVSNSASVLINTTTGQLGTVSSSRRFKEDIQDMDDASSGLLRLRPVTFRYQKPYADGSKPIDYGLIAEEVAEVYPDLLVKSANGQIETVQYHNLTPMLLNEVQKDHETILSLQAQVAALQKALEPVIPKKVQP